MATLGSLFDLTRSALAADQAALAATSNNVANQNTVGYTRQVVSFTAGDSVSLSGNTQVASSGPEVTVASKRDRVLEQRVQQATGAEASSSAQSAALGQIENVFSLSGGTGATAIGSSIDGFFSSLTALAADPSDTATRQAVLSAAGTLAGAFNSASAQLTAVGTGLAAQVSGTVAQVNSLTAGIAKLNSQITALSPDADAGTLEDQRQNDLAQLSGLVGVDQISTENNGLTLTTQGGAVLVAGSQSFALSASVQGTSAAVEDSTGQDVTSGLHGGSLGGTLAALTTTLPSTTFQLDSLAYRVGTAVNAQNAAGLTATGAAGGAIFTLGSAAAGSAAAIAVATTDPGAIAGAGTGEGSGGSTNALALEALGAAVNGAGQTISGQFAGLLASVGTAAATASDQNTTDQASLTQLTSQRDSLSGVSLDEEAANLSQYQRAYEAGAKVLSILDTLFADSINLGTETTVS